MLNVTSEVSTRHPICPILSAAPKVTRRPLWQDIHVCHVIYNIYIRITFNQVFHTKWNRASDFHWHRKVCSYYTLHYCHTRWDNKNSSKYVTNITLVTLNYFEQFLIKSSWLCIDLQALRVYIKRLQWKTASHSTYLLVHFHVQPIRHFVILKQR
jgi:hypothetical protein